MAEYIVRGRTLDMWATFSEETLSSRSDVPTVLRGKRKCSEGVLFAVQTALHNRSLYCYLDGMCHKTG